MPDTFTVACWVKLDSFSYFGAFVISGADSGPDESGFYLYNYGWEGASGQDFGLGIRTENEEEPYYVETASIYETNTWYHLAATYDDANNASVYVDGLLAGGPTDVGGPIRWISSETDSYPEYFVIGVLPAGSLTNGWWVDGSIDDVRLYNYALSPGEISVLAEQVSPGTEVYQPVPSIANLTDPEGQGSRKVNFHDYRILADHWLEDRVLWP